MIHVVHGGCALCGAGMPSAWPVGDRWVRLADVDDHPRVDCPGCRDVVGAWVARTATTTTATTPTPKIPHYYYDADRGVPDECVCGGAREDHVRPDGVAGDCDDIRGPIVPSRVLASGDFGCWYGRPQGTSGGDCDGDDDRDCDDEGDYDSPGTCALLVIIDEEVVHTDDCDGPRADEGAADYHCDDDRWRRVHARTRFDTSSDDDCDGGIESGSTRELF